MMPQNVNPNASTVVDKLIRERQKKELEAENEQLRDVVKSLNERHQSHCKEIKGLRQKQTRSHKEKLEEIWTEEGGRDAVIEFLATKAFGDVTKDIQTNGLSVCPDDQWVAMINYDAEAFVRGREPTVLYQMLLKTVQKQTFTGVDFQRTKRRIQHFVTNALCSIYYAINSRFRWELIRLIEMLVKLKTGSLYVRNLFTKALPGGGHTNSLNTVIVKEVSKYDGELMSMMHDMKGILILVIDNNGIYKYDHTARIDGSNSSNVSVVTSILAIHHKVTKTDNVQLFQNDIGPGEFWKDPNKANLEKILILGEAQNDGDGDEEEEEKQERQLLKDAIDNRIQQHLTERLYDNDIQTVLRTSRSTQVAIGGGDIEVGEGVAVNATGADADVNGEGGEDEGDDREVQKAVDPMCYDSEGIPYDKWHTYNICPVCKAKYSDLSIKKCTRNGCLDVSGTIHSNSNFNKPSKLDNRKDEWFRDHAPGKRTIFTKDERRERVKKQKLLLASLAGTESQSQSQSFTDSIMNASTVYEGNNAFTLKQTTSEKRAADFGNRAQDREAEVLLLPPLPLNPSSAENRSVIGRQCQKYGNIRTKDNPNGNRSSIWLVSDLGARPNREHWHDGIVYFIGRSHELQCVIEECSRLVAPFTLNAYCEVQGVSGNGVAMLRDGKDHHKAMQMLKFLSEQFTVFFWHQYVRSRGDGEREAPTHEKFLEYLETLKKDEALYVYVDLFVTGLLPHLFAFEEGLRHNNAQKLNAVRKYFLPILIVRGHHVYARKLIEEQVLLYHEMHATYRDAALKYALIHKGQGLDYKLEEFNKTQKGFVLTNTENGWKGATVTTRDIDKMEDIVESLSGVKKTRNQAPQHRKEPDLKKQSVAFLKLLMKSSLAATRSSTDKGSVVGVKGEKVLPSILTLRKEGTERLLKYIQDVKIKGMRKAQLDTKEVCISSEEEDARAKAGRQKAKKKPEATTNASGEKLEPSIIPSETPDIDNVTRDDDKSSEKETSVRRDLRSANK